MDLFKIVVYVPEDYADTIRKVMGEAGAGQLGNYSNCSFSVKGVGRYKPLAGAKPMKGKIGNIEETEEERIETICPKEKIRGVIDAIEKAHPYEEVALDVYPILTASAF